jgi:tripartite-type tricarboxylate transporter receptor subunit TctC
MRIRRAIVIFVLGLAGTGACAQGAYPSKPVRFILPYAAGGMPDVVARHLSQQLGERFTQPVVVDNRPGAAQAIALEAAAKAAPDGHTMVMGTMSGLLFLTASRKSLPYDPFKDIASVTLLMSTPFIVTVHASLPIGSVPELIAYAKANPGKLNYATIGIGSGHHLVTELFKTRTGVNMVHVPFKGGTQAHADFVAGQVQVMFEGPGILPHVRSGKVRTLAVTSVKRATAVPDLVTLNETVLPGFDVGTWFGLSVPAGVPRPIIERLNREMVAILRTPSSQQMFATQGLDVLGSTPEEMTERIRAEYPVWTKVMRAAGIEPE